MNLQFIYFPVAYFIRFDSYYGLHFVIWNTWFWIVGKLWVLCLSYLGTLHHANYANINDDLCLLHNINEFWTLHKNRKTMSNEKLFLCYRKQFKVSSVLFITITKDITAYWQWLCLVASLSDNTMYVLRKLFNRLGFTLLESFFYPSPFIFLDFSKFKRRITSMTCPLIAVLDILTPRHVNRILQV